MGTVKVAARSRAARWGAGMVAAGVAVAWVGLRPPAAEIRVVEGWAMPNHTGAAISLHASADASTDAPGEGYIVAGADWRAGGGWHDGADQPTCVGTDTTSVTRVRLGVVDILPADAPSRDHVVWLECLADTVRPAAIAPAPAMRGSVAATPHDPPDGQAPELIVSAEAPFPWVVAVVAEDDRGWCVVAARGTTAMPDRGGHGCDGHLDPDDDVSWTESGVQGQRLAWGVAPAGTDEVLVEFVDGRRRTARLAPGDTARPGLWAIGARDGTVRAVEAQGAGWAAGRVAIGDGWGVDESLAVLAGAGAIAAVGAAMRWRRRQDRV